MYDDENQLNFEISENPTSVFDIKAIKEKSIVLTGDRPTGRLHLGHYVGSLLNRIAIQNTRQIYKQYIMIADLQAFTDNAETISSNIKSNVYNIVCDYIAAGIDIANLQNDHEKNVVFIQSQIPELSELTVYFLNLVSMERVGRNPTLKTEIQNKKYLENSVPLGFFCYPVSQAADIALFKTDYVPVGADQLPMIEQTNEIVRKFNRLYKTNCLKETKAIIGNIGRLVGIDGQAKAGKSLNNAIYLCDSQEEVKRKVFAMFTDPEHIKISDPGKVEGNAVFAYLDAFYEDKEALEELKAHYKRGGLGDVHIKNLLNETLQKILEPIRERYLQINKKDVIEILHIGNKKAQIAGRDTFAEIQGAMGLSYFD